MSTAAGEDILSWLNGAITQLEETARAASPSPWSANEDNDSVVAVDGIAVAEVFALSGGQLRATTAHITLNDPVSVLRRCAADRKLMALHGPCSARDRSCKGCGFDNREEPMVDDYEDCPVLCALAEGYGWTGGDR